MKSAISLFLALAMVVGAGLGCGMIGRIQEKVTGSEGGGSSNSNKNLTDKAVDTAVGESKIGVPECDEVMDAITAELNNSDENFVTKAIKATVLNRIKDGIKQSVEDNKTDKVEMAKTCKEFKTQFEKYKAEEQKKAAQ